MLSSPIPTEEERIALVKMFKAIAEYGRKIRLQQQAKAQNSVEQKFNSQGHILHLNNTQIEKEESPSK
jgi:hypothetical protein